jgi:hypothetical protein
MSKTLERVFHWDRKIGGKMRQGERCVILPTTHRFNRMVQVQFEDGHTTVVERTALREPRTNGSKNV